jgi:multicomponent K+:H+ antiporter subunit G
MNDAGSIPVLAALLTAALLVAGAAITLVGTLGLIKFQSFYQRVHAPTLGTTLGTACISLASMIYFSALGSRIVVHEILIVLFVTVTTPITLIILVRAAVFRDETESNRPILGARQTSSGLRSDGRNGKDVDA